MSFIMPSPKRLVAILLLLHAAAAAPPRITIGARCGPSSLGKTLRGLVAYRSLGMYSRESIVLTAASDPCVELSHGGVSVTFDGSGDGTDVALLRHANDWLREHFSATVVFKNVGARPLEMYWVHVFNKERQLLATLLPGDERTESTHVGHVFAFRRVGDANAVLGYATIAYEMHPTPQHVLVPDDLAPLPGGPAATGDATDAACGAEEADKDIKWHTARSLIDYWHTTRTAQSWVQAHVVRSLIGNQRGWVRGSLPIEMQARLAGALAAALPSATEEHAVSAVFNQEDVATLHAPLPRTDLDAVGRYLGAQARAFAGEELAFSSSYGARVYQTGASIAMHADPLMTQVVTAILNVGQVSDNNQHSAWPLRMCRASSSSSSLPSNDHDDGWQCDEVRGMAPGEFVLLESARIMHGRPQPLVGPTTTKYANAFWHWAIADRQAWDYAWL